MTEREQKLAERLGRISKMLAQFVTDDPDRYLIMGMGGLTYLAVRDGVDSTDSPHKYIATVPLTIEDAEKAADEMEMEYWPELWEEEGL